MPLALQPGQSYGSFQILEVIGSGGFAQVYRAKDPRFADEVALKLSNEPVVSADAAQRTLREVTVLRNLSNPHVVRIHDCGLGRDGHVYVVMELLPGWPLDEFHPFDTKMAPGWALHFIHQACLGLSEAHDLGVVHRDLKPANLFVGPDRHLRVLDFGLARSFDSSGVMGAPATVGHMLVGTPHYAQPEQLQTYALTPAADVYSLGMILYELVSGHTPFDAGLTVSQVRDRWFETPARWLRAHAETPVIPLRTHLGADVLSTELATLVERCLAKQPGDRPRDARELAQGLRAAWPQ